MVKHEINAVEMARKIRNGHYEQLKGKPARAWIRFYRRKAQALYAKLEKLAQEILT
jgi:hypothetical protein